MAFLWPCLTARPAYGSSTLLSWFTPRPLLFKAAGVFPFLQPSSRENTMYAIIRSRYDKGEHECYDDHVIGTGETREGAWADAGYGLSDRNTTLFHWEDGHVGIEHPRAEEVALTREELLKELDLPSLSQAVYNAFEGQFGGTIEQFLLLPSAVEQNPDLAIDAFRAYNDSLADRIEEAVVWLGDRLFELQRTLSETVSKTETEINLGMPRVTDNFECRCIPFARKPNPKMAECA